MKTFLDALSDDVRASVVVETRAVATIRMSAARQIEGEIDEVRAAGIGRALHSVRARGEARSGLAHAQRVIEEDSEDAVPERSRIEDDAETVVVNYERATTGAGERTWTSIRYGMHEAPDCSDTVAAPVVEIAAALASFVRGLLAAPFSRRRARRIALEAKYEAFLTVAARLAVTCQQEFADDPGASSPIGRGLTRFADTLVTALFSDREIAALQRVLMPGKARDLQKLRDEYIEASIALSRAASHMLSRKASHAVIEALQGVMDSLDRWATAQTNTNGMDEWVGAIATLKSAYDSALHPRRLRHAFAAIARRVARFRQLSTTDHASIGTAD